MRLVILDKASLDCGDLNFSKLNTLGLIIEEFDSTNPDQISERILEADIVVTNKVIIDSDIIKQAKNLKLICITATGTNNVDLVAAKQKEIVVCNVTGYATSSVVQHVFMLITALNTNLSQYRQALKAERWSESKFFCLLDFPITDLEGKILGIIGYGELGRGVAKVAAAFGMKILIAESLKPEKDCNDNRVALTTLLSKSDIVSLHCPLTPQTENLISDAEFEIMKSSALLINTARGGIVNENALLHALNTKQIAGAGVDVLVNEPPLTNEPLLTSELSNLIVTPHIAWASLSSRQRLFDSVISNIEAFLRKSPTNVVNN